MWQSRLRIGYIVDVDELTRYIDINAIADLALRNFVKMGGLVGYARFFLQKKTAKNLSETYPDFHLFILWFLSVTFLILF